MGLGGSPALTAAPLRAADYADVVWGGCEQVVLMSATATEHTMAALGIEDVEAVPVAAPTPEERRLVKVPDMPALNYRNLEEHLPGLVQRIEQIAVANQRDRRGHPLSQLPAPEHRYASGCTRGH